MNHQQQTMGSRDRDHESALEGYEYIIVGSGPGGGPLAANLARHGHSVLLLEAGTDQGENLNEQVPLFFAAASEDPSMRWDYFVKHYASEKQAAKDPKMTWETPDGAIFVGLDPPPGSKQKGIYYPRAGTLGGCATQNALVTILPHDDDWSHIAEITGDDSWDPKKMRHFYERLERCRYLPEGTPGHGFKGWLETDHNDPSIIDGTTSVVNAAISTVSEKGHHKGSKAGIKSIFQDINSPHPQRQDGVYQTTLQISKAGRRSSPRNYLVATANARNKDGSKKYPLHIRTNCLATRVVFEERHSEGHKPRAIGVEFLEGSSLYAADPKSTPHKHGLKRVALATREVILSAGAFNTPQLLKLSGIGPAAELQKHHIPLVHSLPGVGTNLQDNYEISVVSQSATPFTIFSKSTFGLAGDPSLTQWKSGAGGPYVSNGISVGVLKKSAVGHGDEDLFLFGGPVDFTGFFPGYSRTFGAQNVFTWDVLKVHPKNNAGTVKLRSSDPRDVPDINFNFFHAGHTSDQDPEHDLTAMAEGIALARSIIADTTGPMAPFTEQDPGVQANTSHEIKQAIKNEAYSHHATSTCAIGAADDDMAVLDSRFRVRGVEGLRVVDASSFPRVPGSFPTLPIYMISEKATDVILEDVVLEDDVLVGGVPLLDDGAVFAEEAIEVDGDGVGGKRKRSGDGSDGEQRGKRGRGW